MVSSASLDAVVLAAICIAVLAAIGAAASFAKSAPDRRFERFEPAPCETSIEGAVAVRKEAGCEVVCIDPRLVVRNGACASNNGALCSGAGGYAFDGECLAPPEISVSITETGDTFVAFTFAAAPPVRHDHAFDARVVREGSNAEAVAPAAEPGRESRVGGLTPRERYRIDVTMYAGPNAVAVGSAPFRTLAPGRRMPGPPAACDPDPDAHGLRAMEHAAAGFTEGAVVGAAIGAAVGTGVGDAQSGAGSGAGAGSAGVAAAELAPAAAAPALADGAAAPGCDEMTAAGGYYCMIAGSDACYLKCADGFEMSRTGFDGEPTSERCVPKTRRRADGTCETNVPGAFATEVSGECVTRCEDSSRALSDDETACVPIAI